MPWVADQSSKGVCVANAGGGQGMMSAEHIPVIPADQPAASDEHTTAREGAVPLRILHIINRLDMGGTEYGVLKVMNSLSDDLFDHYLCVLRGFDPELVRGTRLESRVFVVGGSRTGRQFALPGLVRLMRACRPHIVHSRNWGTIEAIPAARLASVPVAIHSEHGYDVEMLAGLPRRRRILRRTVYGLADAVFTVTGELRSFHARQAWIPPDKIRVIYNGVDTSRFAPRPQIRARLREQLSLAEESFVVGSVGRMVPIKDQETLLKAAEILADRGICVRVLLAGAGPDLERHKKLVQGSARLAGRVTFLGVCENVPEVLNAMDVFVLPSISEGMSNTLLEAMASALPVLATRVGGNPELVEDGRSGWLFASRDATELAGQLECLASHSELRRQLGVAARQRAVERFSMERMIEEYRNLYRELAIRRGIQVRA